MGWYDDDDYDYDYDDDFDEDFDDDFDDEFDDEYDDNDWLIEVTSDKYFYIEEDSDSIGKYGEKLTHYYLKIGQLFGIHGFILRNIYIPLSHGKTSEIDLLFITPKGVFVIESKNYSGWIFGSENDQYWTQMLKNKSTYRFYNPILQNRGHIKALKKHLRDQTLSCFSLIVFSERCSLKKVVYSNACCKVIYRDELISALCKQWKELPTVLDEKGMEYLYSELYRYQSISNEKKQQHIKNIQKNLQSSKRIVCPLCGAFLVLRTARQGPHAGKQFYGCSAFPKCRYIKNTDESECNSK